jgi:hypothetical protein
VAIKKDFNKLPAANANPPVIAATTPITTPNACLKLKFPLGSVADSWAAQPLLRALGSTLVLWYMRVVQNIACPSSQQLSVIAI